MEFFQCALQVGRSSSIIDVWMTRRDNAPATKRVEGALLGRVGALADAVVEDVDGCGTGSVRSKKKKKEVKILRNIKY